MTNSKILLANEAIKELKRCVLPYSAARKVYQLSKALSCVCQSIKETEKSIALKFEGYKLNDKWTFKTPDKAQCFVDEYTNYIVQESDAQFIPINLINYLDSIRISASGIEALEGFVDFREV